MANAGSAARVGLRSNLLRDGAATGEVGSGRQQELLPDLIARVFRRVYHNFVITKSGGQRGISTGSAFGSRIRGSAAWQHRLGLYDLKPALRAGDNS